MIGSVKEGKGKYNFFLKFGVKEGYLAFVRQTEHFGEHCLRIVGLYKQSITNSSAHLHMIRHRRKQYKTS